MNCTEVREIIPLAVSGDDPRGGAVLSEHLAVCPVCRREWEVFAGLREFLGEAAGGPAPMADQEFLAGVSRKAASPGDAPHARPGFLGLAVRLSAAAAVLACMVVAVALTANQSSPAREGGPAGNAPGIVTTGPTSPSEVLAPLEGNEVFGLHHAGAPEEAGDLLREIQVIPDPKSSEGSEKGDFPLREMLPVTDVEVCADF